MITGDCVECINCQNKYRIRFNVGHKFPQTSMFHCKMCGEKLVYGFGKDRKKILINVVKIKDDLDLQVINLHPELTIDPEQKSDPYYFPSLDFLSKQMEKGESGFVEMRLSQSSIDKYIRLWDEIQSDFRYLVEGRWPMLEQKYGKNKVNYFSLMRSNR